MSTRTLTLTNTLTQLSVSARQGVPVSVYLSTPGGQAVTDLEGAVLFSGQQWGESAVTDSSGAYSLTVVYPGDLRSGTGAALSTPCTLVVVEGSQITTGPAGFTYASSIVVSTWYPIAPATSGMLACVVTLDAINATPDSGLSVSFDISATAVATNGAAIVAGNPVTVQTDGSGNATMSLWPSSTLTPSTTAYSITFSDGTQWYFTCPVNPTGYQGAYAGGTTYNLNAGTKVSPSDVVLYSSVLYQYINATPAAGHQPDTSPTYWKVWAAEPITWHITNVVSGGSMVSTSGAMTLISDTTLISTAATVNFASIPGTYKALRLYYQTRSTDATDHINLGVQCNGDTGSNYPYSFLTGEGSGAGAAVGTYTMALIGWVGGTGASDRPSTGVIDIYNYAGATFTKQLLGVTTVANIGWEAYTASWWDNSAAITSLLLLADSGDFVVGSRFTLYGIS